MLGSPIMAKLRKGPAMTEYYLNYGLPDIIGVDGGWLKRYCDSIFTQGKFAHLYSQTGSHYNMKEICSKEHPPMIYWIRNDIRQDSNSSERVFLSALQTNLDTETIANEIDSCRSRGQECAYISRTVYKFIPELRNNGTFDSVYALFSDSADRALLRGWKDGKAHNVIIEKIRNKLSAKD
jgi:hypothetical protein